MAVLRSLLSGLRALFHMDQRSLEMDDELRSYLEAAAQDKMRNGISYTDAIRASRVEMGSMETVKQNVRSSGWESAAESLWQDIRYGTRQLVRSPGFTIVAILTLALGIGANTAIFTLVHAVMMKTLPIAHPEQLYRIGEGDLCCAWGGLQDSWGIFDYPFYQHLVVNAPAFDQLAAFSAGSNSKTVRRAGSNAPPQTLNSIFVSGNYFSTMGVEPLAGRLLTPSDDKPESPAVAVMGFNIWQQYFGSDPSILGSTLFVNGLPVTLVGITPPEFFGDKLVSDPAELWIPLNQQPVFEGHGQKSMLHSSGMAWLYVIGRLRPGVERAQAETQTTSELREWLRATRSLDKGDLAKLPKQQIHLAAGGTGISELRGSSKNGLVLLSIASILVLMIACANLANLMLTRTVARYQQTALRLSLGATRLRLMRAVLTESLLLSLVGGAAGILLAYAASKAILLIVFRGATYVPISSSPSLPILGFALLLSILTGIIFGVVPAWIGTRANPSEGLRGSGRSTQKRATQPQKAMVVLQAALSIVLLAVAGLVTQSLRNLEHADLGFQTEGRLLASITPGAAGFKAEQLPAFYEELQDRLGRIPGVRSASFSLNSPQNLCCVNVGISLGGRADGWIGDVNVVFLRVSPRYFETIGIPILRGRAITERDTPSSQHVAVVDQAFVRTFFRNEDPIGKHFGLSLPGHGFDYEIVGVARDTKYRRPASTQSPAFYLPFTQTTKYEPDGYQRLEDETRFPQSVQLSVNGNPAGYADTLRSTLASINPNLAAIDVKTYTEQVAVQFNQERLMARLTSLFGLVALLLASIGLYGVTSYNVTRRTSEIGIRMALGANRGDVVGMMLRSAFNQVGTGLCIGIPLAMLCGRYLAHQLYAVGRFNPLVLAGAAITLSVCTLVASFLPARRAASIEPVQALRSE